MTPIVSNRVTQNGDICEIRSLCVVSCDVSFSAIKKLLLIKFNTKNKIE